MAGRSINYTPSQKTDAINCYEKGGSIKDVAKVLGCVGATARKFLIKNNVNIRGRGRPKKVFKDEPTIFNPPSTDEESDDQKDTTSSDVAIAEEEQLSSDVEGDQEKPPAESKINPFVTADDDYWNRALTEGKRDF